MRAISGGLRRVPPGRGEPPISSEPPQRFSGGRPSTVLVGDQLATVAHRGDRLDGEERMTAGAAMEALTEAFVEQVRFTVDPRIDELP